MDIESYVPLARAAKPTKLTEHAIRRGLQRGDIKGIKLGRDWHLPPDEVLRLAAEYPLDPVGAREG